MTLILHLETSTKACSVALSKDGSIVALKESLSDEFSHSENLTVFIQTVIKEAGLELKDLSAISVTSGPGSYTGLRIGVSTAKGLCYSLGKPLIAIDSLISLALLAKEKHPSTNLCAMIDARRKEVYCAIYSSDLELIKPITADILDEHSYKEYEPFVYFGDGAEKMQEDWQGRNCMADIELHASAKGQIALAFEKYQTHQFEDVAYFEPYYLKDFVTK
jgi:tRNA threonylcarbamoyladenosine biosynthesis protein TsaB